MKKHLVRLVVSALAALSLFACKTDDPAVATLGTDVTGQITFAAEGGSKVVTVTSNAEWNVTLTPANGNGWLSVNKSGGSFTLTAVANTKQIEPTRVAVTVTAGTAKEVVISAKQEAAAPTPTLDTDVTGDILFRAEGGDRMVKVTTNQSSWDVALSPADGNGWLTVVSNEGSFTLSAAENTLTGEPARVSVTITAGTAKKVVLTAKQEAAPEPTLAINVPTEVVFPSDGGNREVMVATNQKSWNAAISPADGNGWLTIAMSGGSFTLTAVENKETTAPVPVVVTVTAGAAAQIIVTVKQDAADALYKVGDLYPDPAAPIGIVWWIDPNGSADGVSGTHGKVLSLDEGASCNWINPFHEFGTTSMDDGQGNTTAIFASGVALGDDTALAWIKNKGEGWYMPGVNEYRRLYAAMSGLVYEEIVGWEGPTGLPTAQMPNRFATYDEREAFNGKITGAGGVAFGIPGQLHWSSTEYDEYDQVWGFQSYTGAASGDYPDRATGLVRAMKAF